MGLTRLYPLRKSLCLFLAVLLAIGASGLGIPAPSVSAAASTWQDLDPDPAATEGFDHVELFYIAHGNGEWMTTNDIFLAHSPDGLAWDSPYEPDVLGPRIIHGVAYAGNRWVAASELGGILTSPVSPSSPLGTWSSYEVDVLVSDSEDLWDVSFGTDAGGTPRTLLTGGNGMIVTSTDNTTWNDSASLKDGSYLLAAANGNGTFVAAGYNAGLTAGVVYYSTDGVNFQPGTIAQGIKDVVYGEGKFVAVGDGGYIATSTDGQTWTQRTNPSGGGNILNGVAYGGGKFVAVGDSGVVISSEDGISWITETPDTAGNFYSIAYGDNRFIVVGPYGLMQTAADPNSTISPTSRSFDKKITVQADVTTTMTLNGNSLVSISNGGSDLTIGADYTVAGNTVTIKKEYLAAQPIGTTSLIFDFSAGQTQTLSITITDTTPTINPTTGSFDKKTSAQADVTTTMTLNGSSLTSVSNGGTPLAAGADYTISGSAVTIKKEYLALQPVGTTSLTFQFSGGIAQTLIITVVDTTPQNSTIDPASASFDKKTTAQADVTTTMTLRGNTLSSIMNGATPLAAGTDYTVTGGTVVAIKKEYLAARPVGTTTLTFHFSAGLTQTLTITVNDTTPTISPASGSFDKKTSAQADVSTTLTLNGHTLSGIANGGSTLAADDDYTVTGGTLVTIKKEYLAAQPVGTTTLTFSFSGGISQTLTITVSDTTPTISPAAAGFDKMATAQADVTTTLTLHGHTVSGIANGASALTEGDDYTVSGGTTVTVKKEYLTAQPVGTTSLTFTFSGGFTQTLQITVSDTTPTIGTTSGSFDKKTTEQADITTALTLNGYTLSGISNGGSPLTSGADYTVTGGTNVAIKKEYLAAQPLGTTTLTFLFSSGTTQTLTITVTDTTPTISPSAGSFDKKTSAQADVTTTLTLHGHSLTGIANGASALTEGDDYTVTGGGTTVTIKKGYLALQPIGTTSLTFTFSGGMTQILTITITDTTPTISPAAGSFDKKISAQADVTTTLTLYSHTLESISNGGATLTADTDYTVTGGTTATINKEYLALQPVGTTTLTFAFSGGFTQTLTIAITDTAPTIGPALGSFDKMTSAQADVTTTLTLYSHTLVGIANGGTALTEDTDYTVTGGTTVAIKKEYLALQPVGTTNLTFTFSGGITQTLVITIGDTTPTISPATGSFDKKISAQTDVSTMLTLNGHALSGIANGGAPLVAGTDYTVTGGTSVTIKKEYLALQPVGATSLTLSFTGGATQTLTITVTDTTPTISPAAGSFDKKTTAQADVTTTMTLYSHTLGSISNGGATLAAGTDYTVTGGTTVTIKKEYLALQPVGTTSLTFTFSGGITQTLTIAIADTTPTISPVSGSFDKLASAQADVTTTLTLHGHTLNMIENGSALLLEGDAYMVTGGGTEVTIKKEYLALLPAGTASLTFTFSGGIARKFAISIVDTTPEISPSAAGFDKLESAQADVTTTLTLNGHALSGIASGGAPLVAGTDYTVTGGTSVTIKKEYLALQPVGTTSLTFDFGGAATLTLVVTIVDTTPQLTPATAGFDKKTSLQADVTTTLTLNGHALSGISNGGVALAAGTDYTVTGGTEVTVKKEYLASQPVGTTSLVFDFGGASAQILTVAISDTTPSIHPAAGSFDKKTSAQADVTTVMTTYGYTLNSISNGGTALAAAADYTVSGDTVTIKKEYLALQPVGTTVLTFTFSDGTTRLLTITVRNTTRPPTLPETPSITIEVMISGKPADVGTTTTALIDGQDVATFVFDAQKLEDALETASQSPVITISASGSAEVVIGELSGLSVKLLQQKDAVLVIRTEQAVYTLPAELIDIESVANRIGQNIELRDVKLQVAIAVPGGDTLRLVQNSAAKNGFTVKAPPIDFTAHVQSGNTVIEIDKFNGYLQRLIAIPDGAELPAITTGVVIEPDGTARHVPTKFVVIGGKYFAQMNSLTNSTYALIGYPAAFRDAAEHWAKDAVNDLGSRMIVSGNGDGLYDPNKPITRAEFTAIVIRGLGLKLENGAARFSDVKPSDWYNGAILTANAYGLINGFEDGSFRPLDPITREQAMTIIAKAMAITGLKAKLPAGSAPEELLQAFGDADEASGWAVAGIADCLQAGIVTGRDGATLAPKASITRAEVAVIVQRLLNKSELI